jgi:hypothetical protein
MRHSFDVSERIRKISIKGLIKIGKTVGQINRIKGMEHS